MKFKILLFLAAIYLSKVNAQNIIINELMSSNSHTISDEDGNYPDWFELFNPGQDTVNLGGYGISNDSLVLFKWVMPEVLLFPQAHLLIFASGKNKTEISSGYLHTNFKLNASGGLIIITNPIGYIIDFEKFGKIGSDVSLGRYPDGSGSWFLFSDATPGYINTTQGYSGISSGPSASLPGGFYSGQISINLTTSSDYENIYYTLDGSEPDEASKIYSEPIQLNSTTVLRAKVFKPGYLPSRTLINTYILNFSSALPVIAISTDPANLFDEQTGIYTLGINADTAYPYYGANFWQDWEKPVHVELFEPNGLPGFSIDAGIQIYGGWSRANAQKSFAVYLRGQYGYNSLNYKLFNDQPFIDYKSFVLRNSGNDWTETGFRDALVGILVSGIDIDKQSYRPSVIFINGEYWGILNIREKINEHFLEQHHNVNPDSLDILESNADVIQGDNQDYIDLSSFIENNNLSEPANYDYIKTKIDIDNFIRYFITEIYCANTDWPGGNIKYWRNGKNGKWKWILFDTDWGFGLSNPEGFLQNTLEFVTDPNSTNESNPPWSTLFLRKLLENESFKNDFINCFADFSNSIFSPPAVIRKIDSIKSLIEPEILRHSARWDLFSFNEWLDNVQELRDFANLRIAYMQHHFIQKFGLCGLTKINLSISDTLMGTIKINSLNIKAPAWNGTYFLNVPIKIIAQSKRGFHFVGWEGSSSSNNDVLNITLQDTLNLNAVFEADSNFIVPKIVINEINYNSASSFNTGDWIELYNNDKNPVDLTSWIFKDSKEDHAFIFPNGTVLKADRFLVLCSDTSLFKPLFPEVKNFIGNIGFGLNGKGELIRLYDNYMTLIDSLTYCDEPPWPTQPDGNGSTLSLKNPDLDNSLGENWTASESHGTPGKANKIFTNVYDKLSLSPGKFQLDQNYPNPFNTLTSIHFSVGRQQFLTLKIYDVLGREIQTLVSEKKPAGIYEVKFNGDKLPSGIYFCRLQSENFVQTKKLILLK